MPRNSQKELNQEATYLGFNRYSFLSISLICIAFLGMVFMTLGKWSELLIDYGVQVYIPWQLSMGKVLYQDIHYFIGPLSSYVHSFLFQIFGPGILVLNVFNLLIIIILALLIFNIFKSVSNEMTGVLTSLTFLFIFAFGQYSILGISNFVSPYHYELTHGIFLSFFALSIFRQYLESPELRKIFILGTISGLIFLSKFEVFLAFIISLGVGSFILLFFGKNDYRGENKGGTVVRFCFCNSSGNCFCLFFTANIQRQGFGYINSPLVGFLGVLPTIESIL